MKIVNKHNNFGLFCQCALRAIIELNDLSAAEKLKEFLLANQNHFSYKDCMFYIWDVKERMKWGYKQSEEVENVLLEIKNQFINLYEQYKQEDESAGIESVTSIIYSYEIILHDSEYFGELCFRACQYAVGRMTYITKIIPEFIYANKNKLIKQDIIKIVNYIEENNERNGLGMEYDRKRWLWLVRQFTKHNLISSKYELKCKNNTNWFRKGE